MAYPALPESEHLMSAAYHGIELLTVAEAAAILRVSKMTVYRHVHSGELPSVHFGRSFRIPVTAIEAYLAQADTSAEAEEP